MRHAILLALIGLSGCTREATHNNCNDFRLQPMPEGVAKTSAEAAERAQICIENASYRLSGAPDGSQLVAKVATDSCSLVIVNQSNLAKKEKQDFWSASELMEGYREQALLNVMEIRSARCPAVR